MKTLDEVIDYCEGKQICGEWVGIADALHYLEEYRNSKATLGNAMEWYTQATLWHMDESNKLAAQRFVMEYDNPLTWDELCKLDMIGSPVWNSNTRRWMLIIDSANDGTWIDLVNHAGGHEKWIEHDLRKNPLYRKER